MIAAMHEPVACAQSQRSTYRYYVSQAVLQGRQEGAGSIRRVSAEAIESLIERTLCKSLPQAKQAEWARLSIEQKRERTRHLIERITIRATTSRSDRPNRPRSVRRCRTVRIDAHRDNHESRCGRTSDRAARWCNRRELIGLS